MFQFRLKYSPIFLKFEMVLIHPTGDILDLVARYQLETQTTIKFFKNLKTVRKEIVLRN